MPMSDAMRLETSRALGTDPHGSSDFADFPSLTAEQEHRLAWMLNAHFASVWRAGRRVGLPNAQAEENAQEAFAIAARKLDRIAQGRERAFLLGVAVRLAANARRRLAMRMEQVALDPLEHEATDGAPLAEELLARKQQRALLDRILQSMSDVLREVLMLYEIEDLSLPEIAEALEIPEGTAASRLRRARQDFSQKIGRLSARLAHCREEP